MHALLMPESLRITLSYKGPSVDEGTMPVAEVVDALQGFSGAYSKLAPLGGADVQHQLRVTAIKQSSFDLHIGAWLIAKDAAQAISTAKTLGAAAIWVFKRIASVITVKKHVKNKPYSISVEGNENTVVIVNADGANLAVPVDVIEILREGLIDSDLKKIAAPLNEGSIESTEIVAQSDTEPDIKTTIAREDKEYFRPDESVETTREMEIIGTLISLNKESSRGTFKLGDGKNVPYHYSGTDREGFHRAFGNTGPVRATAEVTFDSNLLPTCVELKEVHAIQSQFPFPQDKPTYGDDGAPDHNI